MRLLRTRQLCGLEVLSILVAILVAPFALLIGIACLVFLVAQWSQLDNRNRRRWIRNGVIAAMPVMLLAYVMVYGALGMVLCGAAESGNVPIVRALLAIGVSKKSEDLDRTPMQWATQNGHAEVVSVLLEHGDVFNADDGLSCSIEGNMPGLAEFSLKHGAKVDFRYQNGQTPLTVAVEDGRVEIVRMLLKHGAVVNEADGKGKTPLDSAVDEQVKRILMEAGAKRKPTVQ